jgi:hypothetical protein
LVEKLLEGGLGLVLGDRQGNAKRRWRMLSFVRYKDLVEKYRSDRFKPFDEGLMMGEMRFVDDGEDPEGLEPARAS